MLLYMHMMYHIPGDEKDDPCAAIYSMCNVCDIGDPSKKVP